jgi:hypothetical protein
MIVWFLILGGAAFWLLKRADQQQRIALLGATLARFDIEKLMESLTDGYLRALGEEDAERQAQVWSYLAVQEQTLSEQFSAFAAEFATQGADQAQVSTLPIALPFAARWWPGGTFDARAAFSLHARGLAAVVENRAGLSPKTKAFTLSAELFLMQHSCHWFCRSRAVASARLMARHKTSYAQVLKSVSGDTREAYVRLVGRKA